MQGSPRRLPFQECKGVYSRVFLTALFKNSTITEQFYIEFYRFMENDDINVYLLP